MGYAVAKTPSKGLVPRDVWVRVENPGQCDPIQWVVCIDGDNGNLLLSSGQLVRPDRVTLVDGPGR